MQTEILTTNYDKNKSIIRKDNYKQYQDKRAKSIFPLHHLML